MDQRAAQAQPEYDASGAEQSQPWLHYNRTQKSGRLMGLPHIQKEPVSSGISVGHHKLIFLIQAEGEENHLQSGQGT